MSVRVVRTRNGEDVICDLYEVTTKEEPDKPVGFQLKHPYSVWVSGDTKQPELLTEGDEVIAKISEPQLNFDPYAPLSKDKNIMLKLDEVVTVYETHDQVIEKYNQLVEAESGRDTDQTSSSETET